MPKKMARNNRKVNENIKNIEVQIRELEDGPVE